MFLPGDMLRVRSIGLPIYRTTSLRNDRIGYIYHNVIALALASPEATMAHGGFILVLADGVIGFAFVDHVEAVT